MKLSCGIVILSENGKILMCQPLMADFYDLPKGGMDEGETRIQCAIRECEEETGLKFTEEQLLDLGEFDYTVRKRLHLFLTHVTMDSIDPYSLECRSLFKASNGEMYPEIGLYKWIDIMDTHFYCTPSMDKTIRKVRENLTMTPWIANYSMADIMKGSHLFDENTMLIQISDTDCEPPTPFHKFKGVHHFYFMDVNGEYDCGAIADFQAQYLYDILEKYLDLRYNVVVQCHAGKCRSGAVAEAGVMMGFRDIGTHRIPNLLVKNKILKCAGLAKDQNYYNGVF